MEAIWLGAQTELMEKALVGLQSRWSDTRLISIPSAQQLADSSALETAEIVFLHLGEANAAALEDIRVVRELSEIPIMALADASSGPLDRVKALYLGCDTVIPAHCGPLEIQAHATALLRRSGALSPEQQEAPIQAGDILISPAEREVRLRGELIHLTPTEFRLLHALARRRGAIATHEMLERAIWGESPGDTGNILRKYVQRLRSKLRDSGNRPRRIVTIPGVGYRLATDVEGAARLTS